MKNKKEYSVWKAKHGSAFVVFSNDSLYMDVNDLKIKKLYIAEDNKVSDLTNISKNVIETLFTFVYNISKEDLLIKFPEFI